MTKKQLSRILLQHREGISLPISIACIIEMGKTNNRASVEVAQDILTFLDTIKSKEDTNE